MNAKAGETDYVPVTGESDLAKFVRDDIDDLRHLRTHSDLDLHIVRLLSLHPQLKVRFRNQDLASLDDAGKQALLHDMNDLLGIEPLAWRRKMTPNTGMQYSEEVSFELARRLSAAAHRSVSNCSILVKAWSFVPLC